MVNSPVTPGLGTRLRHLLELLDNDIAQVYTDLGLDGFRPRFTLTVRALAALGPTSIRDLARAMSVTHSAASQTVAQLKTSGLVTLTTGADARERIVHLTDKARAILPTLEAEWAATDVAAAGLEAELPFSLTELLNATLAALERQPLRERVAKAAHTVPAPMRDLLRPIASR